MGYYSNLAAEDLSYDHDCSYTPPEKQLLWRLQELQERLEELTGQKRRTHNCVTFSESDLRYVLPEHFMATADVHAAIALAIQDLKDRYGIHIGEDNEEETPAADEIPYVQISFLDMLSVPLQHNKLCAA